MASTYEMVEARSLPIVLVWCNGETTAHPASASTTGRRHGTWRAWCWITATNALPWSRGSPLGTTARPAAWRSVRDAMSAAGLALDDGNLEEAEYSLEAGGRASGTDVRPAKPAAVICGNDVLAAGVMKAARELGLSVPEDLSITGFDNIELASVLDPALTTVHVPHRRMGWTAADKLLEIQSGSGPGANTTFNTDLVVRGSLKRVG